MSILKKISNSCDFFEYAAISCRPGCYRFGRISDCAATSGIFSEPKFTLVDGWISKFFDVLLI
ncbi:hypothetical protein A7K99_13690 [Tatumella citrea]|uniref:Uncharacterized protein n=1 Tax=Tatumella citrea TaxID=53336 RepID=A0A1Y0LKZ7_TATCI|nr:hypothetical protein A7K98_13705 [Tatumella citrea]ARU98754.1 hypothetical protein A7K99_13690 [Tatumella citrea]